MAARRSALPGLLGACWLLAAPGEAAEPVPTEPVLVGSGTIGNETAVRVRRPRWVQKSQTRFELDLEAELSDTLRLRGIGRVLYDPRRLLVGDDPDYGQEPIDRWQVAGTRSTEAELRELYFDWTGHLGDQRFDLRVGKQQIVWGQSLGLRVLDAVNAQEYREFLLEDFIDARIPTFGARLETPVGDWSLDAFVVPDFESNRLPDPSSEFALDPSLPGLLPPLAEAGAEPTVVTFDVTAVPPGGSFPLTIPVTLDVARLLQPPLPIVRLDSPRTPHDWRSSSTSLGFALSRSWRALDLSLNYLDALDPSPAFARRTSQEIFALPLEVTPFEGQEPIEVLVDVPLPVNHVEPRHVRVRSLGGSVATTAGAFALWAEGMLGFGRAFVVDDPDDADGLERHPDLRYVLGADWTGWEPLFANVQWIQQIAFGHASSLEVGRYTSFASLLLRFDLRRQTLFPQLFVLYGLDEADAMIRPSLEWRASDRLTLALGADLFTGGREGLFGQYAHRRRCVGVPEVLADEFPDGCLDDPPPGRPSRVFLGLRYAFEFAF